MIERIIGNSYSHTRTTQPFEFADLGKLLVYLRAAGCWSSSYKILKLSGEFYGLADHWPINSARARLTCLRGWYFQKQVRKVIASFSAGISFVVEVIVETL